MSNYSHALEALIQEHFDGRQLSLAEKCDISQAVISKHCTGKYRPDLDTLEKICSALEPGQRAKLAIAHLNDETPPSARYYVTVKSSEDSGASVIHEIPPALYRVDNKTRRALEFIAGLAMESKDACDAIQSTAQFLGADLSKDAAGTGFKRAEAKRKKIPAVDPNKLNES